MGREVRRVPKHWQHPRDDSGDFIPLRGESYGEMAAEVLAMANKDGLQAAVEWFGSAPERDAYMPEWSDDERTHFMMYENTTEGTPISPSFATPEELARWLADTGASSFGYRPASYEAWLAICRGAYAPSMVVSGGEVKSGVEFAGETADRDVDVGPGA